MGVWLLVFGVPITATLLNLIALIFSGKCTQRFRNGTDIFIFGAGIPLTTVVAYLFNFKEWNVPINYVDAEYTPIAFESMPTFLTLCAVALISFGAVRIWATKMPPLTAALCYAGMYIGMALSVMVCVQLWEPTFDGGILYIFLMVFPVNYILCCIRVMRDTVREIGQNAVKANYCQPILRVCANILSKAGGFLLISFVLVMPLLGVLVVVLLLFGQQPDAAIRAFTQTAEWTLSQQIPPPALSYDGHYLCTVAARGDEKLVKPLRAGRRHGRLIVVNRQLLVANAFEELLAQRTPRLHRVIRNVYDTYGRPISKQINTRLRSDIVYLAMKPPEWLFVATLYLFDRNPENRIAVQYTK